MEGKAGRDKGEPRRRPSPQSSRRRLSSSRHGVALATIPLPGYCAAFTTTVPSSSAPSRAGLHSALGPSSWQSCRARLQHRCFPQSQHSCSSNASSAQTSLFAHCYPFQTPDGRVRWSVCEYGASWNAVPRSDASALPSEVDWRLWGAVLGRWHGRLAGRQANCTCRCSLCSRWFLAVRKRVGESSHL